jgi:hypothetical protein
MKEFIIGRGTECNQPFKINSDSVHLRHAKICISDGGVWTLEDLHGAHGNGTYVRDDEGEFRRVLNVQIKPESVIRLASGGHHSFVFTAHRLLQSENDFSWEIERVRSIAAELKREEEKENRRIQNLRVWPMLLSAICLVATFLVSDMRYMRLIMGSQTICIGLISFIFGGPKKLQALRKKRTKIVVCPNCQRPMSDFDLENRQCSICKAH